MIKIGILAIGILAIMVFAVCGNDDPLSSSSLTGSSSTIVTPATAIPKPAIKSVFMHLDSPQCEGSMVPSMWTSTNASLVWVAGSNSIESMIQLPQIRLCNLCNLDARWAPNRYPDCLLKTASYRSQTPMLWPKRRVNGYRLKIST